MTCGGARGVHGFKHRGLSMARAQGGAARAKGDLGVDSPSPQSPRESAPLVVFLLFVSKNKYTTFGPVPHTTPRPST